MCLVAHAALCNVRMAHPLCPKDIELTGTHLEMVDTSNMEAVTPDCNAAIIFQIKQHGRRTRRVCCHQLGLRNRMHVGRVFVVLFWLQTMVQLWQRWVPFRLSAAPTYNK